MKYLILIIIYLLWPVPKAKAAWFFGDDKSLKEAHSRIEQLETAAQGHQLTLDRWKLASGCLGIGCITLFVLGTALGAQTRKHHEPPPPTRRLGAGSSPSPNGKKPAVVRKSHHQNGSTTLAA